MRALGEDPNDARVLEPDELGDLPREAGTKPGLAQEADVGHLHDDLASQVRVLAQPHGTHASVRDLAIDAVDAEQPGAREVHVETRGKVVLCHGLALRALLGVGWRQGTDACPGLPAGAPAER